MIFRPTREQEPNPRFFAVRSVLLIVGASLGAVGMVSNQGWLVYSAMGVIAVGILLRFMR